jgi:hypothetical protein
VRGRCAGVDCLKGCTCISQFPFPFLLPPLSKMTPAMNKSASVIIVGGGTFGMIFSLTRSHDPELHSILGLSTAWYLARAGYTNIQCLDRWPVPSKSSAGYDRNKACHFFLHSFLYYNSTSQIVRTEYSNPLYSVLSHEAIELWKDPLFKDVFFQTGWYAHFLPPSPLIHRIEILKYQDLWD